MFLAAGFEEVTDETAVGAQPLRKTRIAVNEFVAAMRVGEKRKGKEGEEKGEGEKVHRDEVECLLANMIYKVRSRSLLFPAWIIEWLPDIRRRCLRIMSSAARPFPLA